RAGLFLVSVLRSPPSHAWRSTGESVLPSRPSTRSTAANSGSRASSRLSSTPASGSVLLPFEEPARAEGGEASRTSQVSPSPDDKPDLTCLLAHTTSTIPHTRRTWPQAVPFRPFAVSPTSTANRFR